MREDAHRLIVQALAAAGRKAEALKHYQDLVALLKRELNTEPMRQPSRSSLSCAARGPRAEGPLARRLPRPRCPTVCNQLAI
jgi:DNA-binding SARP family transcriptional activator